MSILDMFKAPASPTPASPAPEATPTPTPSTSEPAAPANPLDQFKDIWKLPATDPNAANPGFNIQPDKFMEIAGQMDFSKGVPADLITAVQAGGDGATTALLEAMNYMAKASYGQSAIASASLIEATYKRAQEDLSAQIEAKIKSMGVHDKLTTENPVYKHEAVAPIITAVQAQLQKTYPNATNDELASMAKNYFQAAMGAVNPAPVPSEKTSEPNWAALLGG